VAMAEHLLGALPWTIQGSADDETGCSVAPGRMKLDALCSIWMKIVSGLSAPVTVMDHCGRDGSSILKVLVVWPRVRL
jgi:hypothetical protein